MKKLIPFTLLFLAAGTAQAVDAPAAAAGAAASSTPTKAKTFGCTTPESESDAGTKAASVTSSNFFDCKAGPLDFSAGPVTSGGFGSQLKGSDTWRPKALTDFLQLSTTQPTGLDVAADGALAWSVDGSWTTKPTTPSNFTATIGPEADFSFWEHTSSKGTSVTPTITNGVANFGDPDGSAIRSVFGAGVRGDLRYRYGTFQSGSTLDKANQFIVGGTASFIEPWFRGSPSIPVSPTVEVSYYKIVDTTGAQGPVPDGIKSDYLQTEFKTRLAMEWSSIGLSRLATGEYPLALDVKYDGSKATEGTARAWQSLWNLGVSVAWDGMPFKTALTYQSGKNGGFTYDKQFLLGIAWNLFTPSTSKPPKMAATTTQN